MKRNSNNQVRGGIHARLSLEGLIEKLVSRRHIVHVDRVLFVGLRLSTTKCVTESRNGVESDIIKRYEWRCSKARQTSGGM